MSQRPAMQRITSADGPRRSRTADFHVVFRSRTANTRSRVVDDDLARPGEITQVMRQAGKVQPDRKEIGIDLEPAL